VADFAGISTSLDGHPETVVFLEEQFGILIRELVL